MLKQAIWLARSELKLFWPALIFTILTVAALGLFFSLFLVQTIYINWSQNVILDFFFLAFLPSLGALFMSKPYLSFRTIKENPFIKRLAFYRTLPISVDVLAWSRMIFMLMVLICLTIVFFSLLYVGIVTQTLSMVDPSQYLMFALFWFGYMLAFGGLNPLVEYGTNGKFLHIFPYLFLAVGLFIAIVSNIIFGFRIVEWSFNALTVVGWFPVFLSIIMGALFFYLLTTALRNRLATRDYV